MPSEVLSQLGAALGNWNDQRSRHDTRSETTLFWRTMDKVAAWLYIDAGPVLRRKQEGMALATARKLPRLLKYWVVIATAIDVSFENPSQEVPTITWDQLAKQHERRRETE